MDGYLTKPIDSRALTSALENFVPQALALRRKAEAAPTAESSGTQPDIDPEILDMAHLGAVFGGLSDEAKTFVVDFVDDVPRMIGDIERGLNAQAAVDARHAAHALKGAANSAGARRLGRIAADLQDRLDDNDLDTAAILYHALLPTHAELHAAIQALRAAAPA